MMWKGGEAVRCFLGYRGLVRIACWKQKEEMPSENVAVTVYMVSLPDRGG